VGIPSALIHENGLPDLRAIRRFALANRTLAHRQGRFAKARAWARLARKALRTLRFGARLAAGTVRHGSHCTHPLFSGTSERESEAATPTSTPESERRHAFREARRRR